MVFVVIVLATWYLTQAVTLSKGPFDIFIWARNKKRWHGGLLECHICFGVWAALFFTWIANPHAPINQIIVDGVATAGVFVILWDASVFFKTVIEAWLYALQMAAQKPIAEIEELRQQVSQLTTLTTTLQADMEAVKHAQQDIAPIVAILRENGCGSLESSPDQPRQQQQPT